MECRFNEYGEDNIFTKTFNGKNKNSLNIQTPKGCGVEVMTIKYQTKDTIKYESTKFQEKKRNIVQDSEFVGKKATVNFKEKGYFTTEVQGNTIIKNPTFNVKTINNKYKIKEVKVLYYSHSDKLIKTYKYKGNGKTTFTKVIKGTFSAMEGYFGKFQISYF